MAEISPGSSLMQGDFIDAVIQVKMSSMIGQIKAEYQREIRKALQEAKLEAADGGAKAQPAEPLLRSAAVANDEGASCHDPPGMVLSVPGVPDSATAEGVECIRLSAGNGDDVTRQATPKSPTRSLGHNSQAHEDAESGGQRSPIRKPVRTTTSASKASYSDGEGGNTPTNGVLQAMSKLDEDEEYALKMMREEEQKKEEAARNLFSNQAKGTAFFQDEHLHGFRLKVFKLISSPKFDLVLGVFIVANAVTIGAESTFSRAGDDLPVWLHVCEYSFLVIYIVELVLRFYALGISEAMTSNWIRFDAMLVCSGLLNLLITVSMIGGEGMSKVMDNLNMLKMIRLFRLARVVRLLAQFRTLWMLVQGLMSCVMPMLWTSVIMLLVIYCFAVAGMELITADEDSPQEYAEATNYFRNIFQGMITLMQFMTLDSINLIYRPLTTESPLLAVYFLTFILVGPIALMNVITAIQVEALFRTAGDDHEAKKAWERMKRKTMMPKLRSIFLALDADGSGEVDLDELMSASPEVKEQLARIVDLDQMEEVFRMLDIDGSGEIGIEEFVDGIMRSQQDNKPTELILIMKQCQAILGHLTQKEGGLLKPEKTSTTVMSRRGSGCSLGQTPLTDINIEDKQDDGGAIRTSGLSKASKGSK